MTKTTKQVLLEQAVARLGLAEVAKGINAPEHLVQAWMSGHATMPDRKLLDLTDMLDRISGPTD
jgi:hypothetical protein